MHSKVLVHTHEVQYSLGPFGLQSTHQCAQEVEIPPGPQTGPWLNFIVLWAWNITALSKNATT